MSKSAEKLLPEWVSGAVASVLLGVSRQRVHQLAHGYVTPDGYWSGGGVIESRQKAWGIRTVWEYRTADVLARRDALKHWREYLPNPAS